jgi:hypothetical protein
MGNTFRLMERAFESIIDNGELMLDEDFMMNELFSDIAETVDDPFKTYLEYMFEEKLSNAGLSGDKVLHWDLLQAAVFFLPRADIVTSQSTSKSSLGTTHSSVYHIGSLPHDGVWGLSSAVMYKLHNSAKPLLDIIHSNRGILLLSPQQHHVHLPLFGGAECYVVAGSFVRLPPPPLPRPSNNDSLDMMNLLQLLLVSSISLTGAISPKSGFASRPQLSVSIILRLSKKCLAGRLE